MRNPARSQNMQISCSDVISCADLLITLRERGKYCLLSLTLEIAVEQAEEYHRHCCQEDVTRLYFIMYTILCEKKTVAQTIDYVLF